MQFRKQILLIIILVISNSSCNTVTPTVQTTPVRPLTNALPPTILPSTLTPVAPTMSISQTDFSCWTIKPLQAGNEIKGSFIYIHKNPFVKNLGHQSAGLFLWNVNSFHTEKLNTNWKVNNGSASVSFDGNTLAMHTDNELAFITPTNVETFSFQEKTSVMPMHILGFPFEYGKKYILEDSSEIGYKEGIGFTDTYYVFDPKANKISTQKMFLPNFHMGYWNRALVRNVYYSSSMKYVLYMSTPTTDNHTQFTLYDIEKETVVMVIPPQNSNLYLLGEQAHWLPKADVITAEFHDTTTNKDNYYFVSLDGEITPVTNFPETIDITSVFLSDPSVNWSPNQRYLVSYDIHLAVYIWDNQDKVLYKPCLPIETPSINQPNLDWSFDGNYFVTTFEFTSSEQPTPDSFGNIAIPNITKKYIFDLANKIIYQLPESVNKEEFTNLYDDGKNDFLGWVNWATP